MTEQRPFVRAGFSTDFTRMLETLLLDVDHPSPQWLQENLWIPFDKEFALSNLSSNDIKAVLHTFLASRAAITMMLPPRSVDWQMISQFEQAYAKLIVKVRRSKDGFERKQLTTQRMITTPKPEEEEEEKTRGLF